jgi:putative transposase
MSAPDRRAKLVRNHPYLSMRRQCAMLGIARSGVYRVPRPANDDDLRLTQRIDELFTRWPFLGSRRITEMLRAEGQPINRKRVRRLMRRMGIAALGPKPRTTRPAPGHRIYPYLLRDVTVERPNQVWAADITYIPLGRGFLYLVAVMEWASRAVLSWRLSNTMDVSFCVSALEEALARFGRPEIFNTDQGSQFTSAAFTGTLAAAGVRISMDGRGRWMGRVEVWRGGCRSNTSVSAPFVWRCLTGSALTPSPHPARQTGRADFPHPAFSRPVRPSISAGRRVAAERGRGRASHRDTRPGSGGTRCFVVPCGASTSDEPAVPCMLE